MAHDDDELAVRVAAMRLGISVWGVHKAIERGELPPVARNPIRVSAGDVEHMRQRRQAEAVERIGVDRLARVAADVRLQLHPPANAPGPRGSEALERLPERVKAALGPLLHGAALPDDAGCRWCGAEVASKILAAPLQAETLTSEFGAALLGGPKCAKHRGLLRGRMESLAARVHPGAVRPSGGRSAASGGSGPVGAPAASPAPARPAQDADGGRALVAARLRTARSRLKEAKRRGDQRGAIQLRKTIQGLEADAAVVDGRTSLAARPGRLRCGHALAAGCGCRRVASKQPRGQQ